MDIRIFSAGYVLLGLGSIYSGYRSISSSKKPGNSDGRKWDMLKIAVGVAAVFAGAALALKNQGRNGPPIPFTQDEKKALFLK